MFTVGGCSVLYDIDSQAVDPRPSCEDAIFFEDFDDRSSLVLVERGIYDFTESGGHQSSGALLITFDETTATVEVKVPSQQSSALQLDVDYVFSMHILCPVGAVLEIAVREVLDSQTDGYHEKPLTPEACDGEQFWLAQLSFTAELDEHEHAELHIDWLDGVTPPFPPMRVIADNYCLQPL